MLAPAEKQVLRLQSEICKTLSHPKRLEILHELREGEKTVGELCGATGLRQANVSQHLALMRHHKMVIERRVGNAVFYRVADKRINKACDIMRDVLIHRASEDSKLVRLVSATGRS
ncbi:ArsR/SmtB family transcription factor [[Eubacterium] cellulosolvens]